MFVELHLLQNFAPSNLNRDETNSPKDCEFGGYRRARISSQAIKRAIRKTFEARDLIPPEHQAVRTKRLAEALEERFRADGQSDEDAEAVAGAVVQGLGLSFQKNTNAEDSARKTQYLLFLGQREIDRLAEVCTRHWDELRAVARPAESAGSGRAAKRAASATVPKEVQKALTSVLDGGKSADVALFGRMIADLPSKNVDAASQVAHAISTNRVAVEFDFYTAVDDRKPEDTEGADMLGTVEFNSACFYRYANVDLDQLRRNLDGDEELARQALAAFIRASVLAIPTGKQNSMAAQNPPSFVLAVVRDTGRWSLANAFLKPVTPGREDDLVVRSEERLDRYWGQLTAVYGDEDIHGLWLICLDEAALPVLESARVRTLNALVDGVLGEAFAADTTGARS